MGTESLDIRDWMEPKQVAAELRVSLVTAIKMFDDGRLRGVIYNRTNQRRKIKIDPASVRLHKKSSQ